jgi:hypothetical protein
MQFYRRRSVLYFNRVGIARDSVNVRDTSGIKFSPREDERNTYGDRVVHKYTCLKKRISWQRYRGAIDEDQRRRRPLLSRISLPRENGNVYLREKKFRGIRMDFHHPAIAPIGKLTISALG